MKGMATCKVCGRDFPLMKEDHYVAQTPRKIGAFSSLVDDTQNYDFDAFDCPHCGCQYIAQERKRLLEVSCCDNEEEYEGRDNEEKYEGACWGCKYYLKSKTDDPCKDCNHNGGKFNKFEQKED